MLEPLERLVGVLARLPGVGRRTAERIALRLVRDRARGLGRELGAVLQEVESRIRLCSRCGNLTEVEADPCRLCTDPRRDGRVVCVVEDPADVIHIERAGGFRGRYHVLMGRISPMRGEGTRHVRADVLVQRIAAEGIEEVVLALNTDVESDATANYLREMLAPTGARLTRIAHGLPAGSGIVYSDPLTLQRALEGRREV